MSALPQQLERVIFALCEDTGTPRALTVLLLVKHREYGQLVDLTIDPAHYTSEYSYKLDVVVTEFLRKFADFDIEGVDKRGVALTNFWSCEQACAKTNARLNPFLKNGPFEDPFDGRVFQSLENMKNWIGNVLGEIPKDLFNSRFGPGATFRDVGKYITVPDKIANRPTMTSECSLLLPIWERTAWASALLKSDPSRSHPEYVRGNRFTTVYKDAKKDRGIAIEASLNVYFQLGIGAVIRNRLYSAGINLNLGQDIHRRVACEASRTGSHATIDLSNASDMCSSKLVEILLSKGRWFDLLSTTRSPLTNVDGQWVYLNKFSSMGNGYTFELETLIFTAIAVEACNLEGVEALPGRDIFVYGDDIIVPTSVAPTVLALLRWFGFQPNRNKTFLEGYFRESCGGDYFRGKAVRPHYVKETPNEPAKWISLANGIRRLVCKDQRSDFRYNIYWRAWLRALDAIPSDIRRLRGPEDLGDLVIHDDREHWRRRRTRDQRTFIKTWAPVIKALPLHHWSGPVVLAAALYGVPSNGVFPRGEVAGYRTKWVSYPE